MKARMHEILQRFESIEWHDSSLLGLAIAERPGGSTEIVLTVSVVATPHYKPASIVLEDCERVSVNVNLTGKRFASHHIGSARCVPSNEVSDDASKAELFDFVFQFVPPGGEIRIAARGFRIDWNT